MANSSSPIQTMFARIAPVYDKLNNILSFGLVHSWRQAVIAELGTLKPRPLQNRSRDVCPPAHSRLACGSAPRPTRRRGRIFSGELDSAGGRTSRSLLAEGGNKVLDCCSGTGELAFLLAQHGYDVIALDNCPAMLEEAQKKPQARNLLQFIEGDAQALPFPDGSFQAVTNAFSLRNLPDMTKVFSETYRVLAPGGMAVFLDLTKPDGWLKPFHQLYLKIALPFLGFIFSRNRKAYSYLAKSIGDFQPRQEIQALLKSTGFKEVRTQWLSGGIATLWSGVK